MDDRYRDAALTTITNAARCSSQDAVALDSAKRYLETVSEPFNCIIGTRIHDRSPLLLLLSGNTPLTECGDSTVFCGANTALHRVGAAEYRKICTEHGMNTVLLAVEPRSTALSVRICAAWLRCILPISGSVRQKHGMVADGTRCQRGHPR